MTGQQLRNSILQEAIQGRLVPNVLQSGERTGAELLLDIIATRQKKENDEKGKKANKLSLSVIEEEPWDLPEGWCWCKLRDICSVIGGFAFPSQDLKGSDGIRVIRISDVTENGLSDSRLVRYCGKASLTQYEIQEGDILMAMTGGTVGKSLLLLSLPEPLLLNQRVAAIRSFRCDVRYLDVVLKSPLTRSVIEEAKNSTNDNISMADINGFMIPLPPLSIQKAIVEKIDVLLPYVDEYDKAAGELEALNRILPDKLRKSVLQEAIKGDLIPNDIPEGEATALELLQQILKERQERENKEKGKKAKKLSLSTIEDEPWELPEGWCWVKIGDIFEHSAGKSLNSSKQSIGKVYPYLTTSNVYWDGINFDKVKEMAYTDEEYKKCSAIKNDILVCEGGDVGRSCIWTYDYTIGLQNHVHRLRAIKNTDVKFFYYVLRFYKAAGIITAKGIGIGGFSANALKGLSVPLPPLSIQHRIVEKIEEVFSAINKL